MLLHTAGIIHREVIIIMLTMDAVISALIPRQAKLLGGSKGIYRRVSNIHTIETKEIAHFIRDHELIFITGVAVSKDTPLEELVRTILKKNVSGIVVNIGFYIHTIPDAVITLCNQKEIPLLSLPWNYVLSDLQKLIFTELISKQHKDAYITYVIEQILHRLYHKPVHTIDYMTLRADEQFYIALIAVPPNMPQSVDEILKTLRKMPDAVHAFKETLVPNRLVVMFRQKQHMPFTRCKKNLHTWLAHTGLASYKAGISLPCCTADSLATAYDEAELSIITAAALAYPQPFIIAFQNISLLKIIQQAVHPKLLHKFMQQLLGKLMEYDKNHRTDLLRFLHVWIKHSGNASAITNELFIHRNTVAYRINKIKTILGYDELTYPIISNLFLALVIKQIISTNTDI